MKITFFGTTTLLFDDGCDQILFDAHLTRPSLPRVFCRSIQSDTAFIDSILSQFDFSRLRSIFISHTHYDHVLDAPYLANACGADLYGSASALQVGRGGGVSEERLHLFHPQDEFHIGAFRIRVLPSVHSPAKWYNNDLGMTIDEPLTQPARKKDFKEGGSFDFLITHGEKSYLIRPSYNFLQGELDSIHADVLFLGIAGITESSDEEKERFYQETIEKVRPSTVIPIHWDNFFCSLEKTASGHYLPSEKERKMFSELTAYCRRHQISCLVLLPESFIEL